MDIIVEMSAYGKLRSDERRRKLFALSRYPETPARVVYEWEPTTGRFTSLGDPLGIRFNDHWINIQAILAKRKEASTHQELLMDWPADQERPSASWLSIWLNRAFEEKRVRRVGAERKENPYRYRLEIEGDKYRDRGELPPLREFRV